MHELFLVVRSLVSADSSYVAAVLLLLPLSVYKQDLCLHWWLVKAALFAQRMQGMTLNIAATSYDSPIPWDCCQMSILTRRTRVLVYATRTRKHCC